MINDFLMLVSVFILDLKKIITENKKIKIVFFVLFDLLGQNGGDDTHTPNTHTHTHTHLTLTHTHTHTHT